MVLHLIERGSLLGDDCKRLFGSVRNLARRCPPVIRHGCRARRALADRWDRDRIVRKARDSCAPEWAAGHLGDPGVLPMQERWRQLPEPTGSPDRLDQGGPQPESPCGSSSPGEETELDDANLVLAIIRGKAQYAELLKRAPDRRTAARFYASIASASFDTQACGVDCEICGIPGEKLTLGWRAILPRRGENVVEALILLPLAFFTLVVGGIIPEATGGADHVEFQTHHTLCRRCRPGLLRRSAAIVLRGIVCLVSLAALATLIFTGAVLVCWMAGALEIDGTMAVAVLPWFVASTAILLTHLTRWPRRLERAIALPPSLRGFASGPFDSDITGSSFRLRAP